LPVYHIGGQQISQFDIWAAVWVASWLIPVLASWILAQGLKSNLSQSIYRNQINYWVLVIALFFVGFALASVRQLGQSNWLQVGILVVIVAAAIGSVTLTQVHLPELQLASRQLISRLAGVLIIFGLTWVALSLIVQAITNLPPATAVQTQSLILVIAAALFAVLFSLIYRWVNSFTQRIFLRGYGKRDVVMAEFSNVIGNMPEPAQLGQMFLRLVQSNLSSDDIWLFTTADSPGGKLLLRPLASIGTLPREVAEFAPDSPLAQHFRQKSTPLVQTDLDALEIYDTVPEVERSLLAKWQRVLYKPLHAGDSLIGILALGTKYTGEGYSQQEFELLAGWAKQVSPLLAQAQNMVSMRQINDYVFHENQLVVREKQHLFELVNLYGGFMGLISGELRRPFTKLSQEMQQQQAIAANGEAQLIAEFSQHIAALRAPIDDLITVSARIQMRNQFDFKPVNLDRLAQECIRNLHNMAEARRVKVDLQVDLTQAAVLGYEQQLLEAVQHLLHNAIKFNKIGGMVMVQCGGDGAENFLRIIDNGVGMPPDRLQTIWSGLSGSEANGDGRRAGMGLALTQFIVKAHGGRVTAESKYGTGSTFTICLPILFED
jgi:signal transduction histidine kinase